MVQKRSMKLGKIVIFPALLLKYDLIIFIFFTLWQIPFLSAFNWLEWLTPCFELNFFSQFHHFL